MRNALALLLLATWLSGCTSQANRDPSGIWINQAAIDAAAQGGSLREALEAYGPNLEWRIDGPRQLASFTNGFELDEGQLVAEPDARWRVDFYGDYHQQLRLKGDQLLQEESESGPEQRFDRPTVKVAVGAPPGSSFEQTLYAAYLGGTWKIKQGTGTGGLVLFHPDGKVEGLPGAERYALCLAGDCAAMSGEYDSLWLQLGEQGNSWIFKRDGEQLEIFEALNRAQADEMPDYTPGKPRWLLGRD
ncbi:hypothetical protein D3879_06200 [Pseudomonas cavernicola]|uniref:Lipoprotein n=1 Tax=Pseudomonas cavernicola TaxID=2320866 RepID=A0A418XK66_9PSED|nr:hypothetical protein [Pseudomonas cavernicola]RJG12868.1 hypothetical protein D3879_06200 [Pseudomonas cavernicola]